MSKFILQLAYGAPVRPHSPYRGDDATARPPCGNQRNREGFKHQNSSELRELVGRAALARTHRPVGMSGGMLLSGGGLARGGAERLLFLLACAPPRVLPRANGRSACPPCASPFALIYIRVPQESLLIKIWSLRDHRSANLEW